MKPLLKVILVLTLVFATTFLIIRFSGVLTEDDIKIWLKAATNINPVYVVSVVVLLLVVDILIAVPTLTICLLSGYFLGFQLGGLSALIGLMAAGAIGYWMSRAFGEKILKIIISSKTKREEAKATFDQYGLIMILLSRSSPIFSEVCACMAGMTRMKFSKFYLAWSINSIPYALIAAYSGSISSYENLTPGIYTMMGLYAVLWLAWFVFRKRKNQPAI